MKIKILILSLSFLLLSCGGPPSENSKTTIMDVVKYLEQVEYKDYYKWRSKVEGLSEEEYLNFISNIDFLDEKTCGKFERYQTKIASMVGAIEGGIIYMENFYCKVEVYRYSSQGAASLNMKSSLIENLQCFTKGYFVFCRIIPALMTGF